MQIVSQSWGARRWLSVLVLALVAAVVLAGCGGASASGGSGQQFTVKMSEFKFEPSTLTVKAGQPVKVSVQNVGSTRHDFVITGLDQPVKVTVDPGKTGSVEFTPTKAGTYEIDCTEPGHHDAGMKGQLVVQ